MDQVLMEANKEEVIMEVVQPLQELQLQQLGSHQMKVNRLLLNLTLKKTMTKRHSLKMMMKKILKMTKLMITCLI